MHKVNRLLEVGKNAALPPGQVLFVDDRTDTVDAVFENMAGDSYAPDEKTGIVPKLLTPLILGGDVEEV